MKVGCKMSSFEFSYDWYMSDCCFNAVKDGNVVPADVMDLVGLGVCLWNSDRLEGEEEDENPKQSLFVSPEVTFTWVYQHYT